MKIRYAAIVAALTIGVFSLNPTGAQSDDLPTWQFSVKFVCGEAQGEGDGGYIGVNNNTDPGQDADSDPVTPGVYETAINLHNPNERTVEGEDDVKPNTPSTDPDFSEGFRKKALVLYPQFREEPPKPEAAALPTEGTVVIADGFERAQPPGFWVRPENLPEDWGMEIDCRDIRAILLGGLCDNNEMQATQVNGPCQEVRPDQRAHDPLIKGYVVIEERSRLPLDVTALYASYIRTDSTKRDMVCEGDCWSYGKPAGFSEQVETITPKKIEDDDDNGD